MKLKDESYAQVYAALVASITTFDDYVLLGNLHLQIDVENLFGRIAPVKVAQELIDWANQTDKVELLLKGTMEFRPTNNLVLATCQQILEKQSSNGARPAFPPASLEHLPDAVVICNKIAFLDNDSLRQAAKSLKKGLRVLIIPGVEGRPLVRHFLTFLRDSKWEQATLHHVRFDDALSSINEQEVANAMLEMVAEMVRLNPVDPRPKAWEGKEKLTKYGEKLAKSFRDLMRQGARPASKIWVLLEGYDDEKMHSAVTNLINFSMIWLESVPHVRIILLGYNHKPPDDVRMLAETCPIMPPQDTDVKNFLRRAAKHLEMTEADEADFIRNGMQTLREIPKDAPDRTFVISELCQEIAREYDLPEGIV